MKKNYYRTLKVSKNAKPAQIKKAYRSAAKRYHPDISPKDEETFKEIQEAYETLSDPNKRALYDQQRVERPASDTRSYHFDRWTGGQADRRPYVRVHFPARRSTGLFQEIDRFFAGLDPLWIDDLANFLEGLEEDYQDLSVEITLTPGEARDGCEVGLEIPILKRCGRCRGTGRAGGVICGLCRGRGEAETKREIKVVIPPGVKNGMEARIPLDAPDLIGGSLIATLKVLES